MKRNFTYLLLFFFSLVCFNINAQELRVIDNKGTLKSVNNNKVTTTNDGSQPLNPVENDVWFDALNNTVYIYDDIEGWKDLTIEHTGTTGSVFFAGTDEKPTENNDHFFWDNTNNQLLLGNRDNSIPTNNRTKLNIFGTATSSGGYVAKKITNRVAYRFLEDTNTGIDSPGDDRLSLITNGTTALRINPNQNVGIGTTSPSQKLDIDGKLRIRDVTLTTDFVNDQFLMIDPDGVVQKTPIGNIQSTVTQEAPPSGMATRTIATHSAGGTSTTTTINETITTLTDSNAAANVKIIATYTNENGSANNVEETVTTVTQNASNTDTQVSNNAANTIATYTNENGSNTTINETVTSISQNQPGVITDPTADTTAGDITYSRENGTTQTANVVSSDANNSIQVGSDGGAYYKQAWPMIGDIKHSIRTTNHNGWYLLNGQTVTGIAATNANSLGISSTLPDATDRVLKHPNGEAIFTTAGNANTILTQANLPNVNFTGSTTSNGSHTHNYDARNRFVVAAINDTGILANPILTPGGTQLTSSEEAHNHNVTINSGGNNTPFSNYQPYLVVNTFIYLGL